MRESNETGHETGREQALFQAAAQLTAVERASFLKGACHGEPALRQRLEMRLANQDEASGSLAADPKAEVVTVISETAPAEEAGLLIGRYKLLEKLGEGGFGTVWAAEQKEPVKRRVALKIIKLGMDTKQVIARFEAERQALAMMDHPNIAKVLDGGASETGRPYFVMELVRGTKITEYCDEAKLSTRERLDLFIKVCQAIQHAHQKGVIHRDIKPSNILVTLHDGVPVPKVIDFGIAKATQQELTELTIYTQHQQFIGTPAYMSPEQAEMSGLDIDTRSDIYSLGVLLYELLTGKTPFDAKELMASGLDAMRKTIREKEPVRPSTRLATLQGEELTTTVQRRSTDTSKLLHQLKGDLDWIVMKCLEKDRTRRYDTANGLAMDLTRHVNHEPVLARAPSLSYRLQKGFRRNRLVFTAAGMVGLALILGVVVSSWQAVQATKAKQAESEARVHSEQDARIAVQERARAEAGEQRARAGELAARRNLYASDMLLANRVHEDGNLDLALELLNRHWPAPGEPDLRGWEWRYLWSACQSDERDTFATNSTSLGSVVFSPDGTLLSAAEYGPAKTAVKIWAFPSGRLIATPETDDAVGSVAFSPNGKLLAFRTKSDSLKLWDIEAQQAKDTFPCKYGLLYPSSIAFSPDGRTLAAGTAGGDPAFPILLWDIEKKTVFTLEGNTTHIKSLAFAPDGKTLVSGGLDGIKLWSMATRQELARLTNHTAGVNCLAFSADGQILVSGSWDKTIRIWDVGARYQIAVLTNHTRWVFSVAFSPDQKTLASAGGDFLLKLWDTSDWQELSTLKGSRDELYCVAFSPDGTTLLSGAKNGAITTWNPIPPIRAPDRLQRPAEVSDWSLGKDTLFGVHTNGVITFWSASTLRQTAHYRRPASMTNDVASAFLSDGKLVWANDASQVVVWDLVARQRLTVLPWVPAREKSITVSPDEKLLIGFADGQGLTVWNLERLQAVVSLPGTTIKPSSVAVSRDLHWVAAGSQNGTVELWDLRLKQRVRAWQAHNQWLSDLAFLPDGKHLVTVSFDATAKVWELETGRHSRSFPRTLNAFGAIAISEDGQRIAARSQSAPIVIWNSSTGQEMTALRSPNTGGERLQFVGAHGETLISFSGEEVRLWRAPSLETIAVAEAKENRPKNAAWP